jgi:enterochelin esterase-like enzyme
MYFGHGITGSARANDMNSRTILGNLVASGEAKDMIIVYTNQWTPVTQAEVDAGNTMNSSNAYTPFINEWAENLHPYMLENFPVAPGRENVAITGFSMGGNMAIRIWMAHPDKIGFVGLGDPPAIVTSSTNIRNSAAGAVNAPRPWLILVTGAEPEGANSVGQGPQNISNALTQNGFDNVWHFVPGSGHNQTVMTPHLYNFLRGIF